MHINDDARFKPNGVKTPVSCLMVAGSLNFYYPLRTLTFHFPLKGRSYAGDFVCLGIE